MVEANGHNAELRFVSAAASACGYSHLMRNLPCQDASCVLDDPAGEWHIAVVSDGHGDPRCARSDTGSKIAFFTGCMIDYKFPEIGHKLVKILKENGIDIDVPEGQVCCGSPLLRTGQTDIVQDLVDKNKEVFKDYDTIITICSGCGATLKNNHPEYGSKLNVMDISEFLVDKLDASKLKEVDMKVTYHDPCHLGRGQGIKDQPREIIEMIPGVEFEEMKYPCQCCGAGGGIKSGKPEIAMDLSKSKAEMIKDTGAEAVVTICPFCELNLQDGLNAIGCENVKSMHILELLDKAYE